VRSPGDQLPDRAGLFVRELAKEEQLETPKSTKLRLHHESHCGQVGMSDGKETRNDGAPAPANAAPAGPAATGSAPASVVEDDFAVVEDGFATDEEDSGNKDARTEYGQTRRTKKVTKQGRGRSRDLGQTSEPEAKRIHFTEHALAILTQDNGGDSDRCRELKQNLNRTCAEFETALAALERGMGLAWAQYPYSLPGIFCL
jgi:hypothetical protein